MVARNMCCYVGCHRPVQRKVCRYHSKDLDVIYRNIHARKIVTHPNKTEHGTRNLSYHKRRLIFTKQCVYELSDRLLYMSKLKPEARKTYELRHLDHMNLLRHQIAEYM